MSAVRRTVAGLAVAGWLAVIVLARIGVSAPGEGGALAPLTGVVAALVQQVLAWGGLVVLRHDALLYVPGGFAFEVAAGCTGVLPALVIAVGILASPATPAAKRLGLAVAIPLVLSVNLLRLIHLFYLGVHAPEEFALAHMYVWEAVLVVFTFTTWVTWMRWANSREVGAARPWRRS